MYYMVMDTAILGFIGLLALFLVPLVLLLIVSLLIGRKRSTKPGSNWAKLLKLNPTDLISALNKIRPK